METHLPASTATAETADLPGRETEHVAKGERGRAFLDPRCASSRGRALLAMATLSVLSGCLSDIQSGIDSSTELVYSKKYEAADRLCRKLLRRLESAGRLDENGHEQRRIILERLGKVNTLYLHNHAQAIVYFEKLLRSHPSSEQAFVARAMIADIYHHKLGNAPAAVEAYQKLVAEFQVRAEARRAQLQIVSAYFQLKDYEQARTEAEALVHRWPKSPEAAQARFEIANSYYLQKRFAEAVATYERLLEGEPESSLASLVLFELGNCFQELGEPERALAYFYACLPDHPNPLLVQNKIRRLRARMRRALPSGEIQLPPYVRRRLAVAKKGGAAETPDDGHHKLESTRDDDVTLSPGGTKPRTAAPNQTPSAAGVPAMDQEAKSQGSSVAPSSPPGSGQPKKPTPRPDAPHTAPKTTPEPGPESATTPPAAQRRAPEPPAQGDPPPPSNEQPQP